MVHHPPPPIYAHARRSFTISLHAPVREATAAFGALTEMRWSPHWHPHFLQPSPPAEVEGAIFTVAASGKPDQVWVLQTWDLERHVVRYVAFDPGTKVTRIEIRVRALDASHSTASVTYDRTALGASGNAEVAEFARHFTSEGPEWETAINAYLAGRE